MNLLSPNTVAPHASVSVTTSMASSFSCSGLSIHLRAVFRISALEMDQEIPLQEFQLVYQLITNVAVFYDGLFILVFHQPVVLASQRFLRPTFLCMGNDDK